MKKTLVTIERLVSEADVTKLLERSVVKGQVICPYCDSQEIIERGYHDPQNHRQ